MRLLLKDLGWWSDGVVRRGDLRLARGRVVEIGRFLSPRRRERVLELREHLAFPGLINGHDHLALNLLPSLGAPPYASMYEFARDVFRPDRAPVADHLRVAVADRLWWGGYRNLISGVTSVAHHDPLSRRFVYGRFPLRVLRGLDWIHSLGLTDDPRAVFERSSGRRFVLHAAEGVDEASGREIDRLDRLGMLTPRTVVVHGVALDARRRRRLIESGAALVWCPASNLRLYGQTAPIAELDGRLPIALGTDSTLSGSLTLFDEMRCAVGTGLVDARRVLDMVSAGAARVFGLDDGRGKLQVGAPADLTVIADPGTDAAGALVAARPRDLALVTVGGAPRLARPELAAALGLGPPAARIDGARRFLYGDLARLRRRIERVASPAPPAGGEAPYNALWTRLEAAGG